MHEHDQILNAFSKRNAALAESAVRDPLANQKAAIRQILQSQKE
jgi:hypothetical protein